MDESIQSKVSDIPRCPFLEDQGFNPNTSADSSDKINYEKTLFNNDLEQGNTNDHAHHNHNRHFNGDALVSTEQKKCLFVSLKPSASYLNLITFYLVQFSYVCFFTFMDSMQPHLLEKEKGYIEWGDDYTVAKANKVSSDLIFYENLYLVSNQY